MTKKRKTKSYPLDTVFSEKGKQLIGGTGKEFIKGLGEEAAKKVVKNVLLGNNLRASTEYLTRRRLSMTSAAVIDMFIEGLNQDKAFIGKLNALALEQIENAGQSDKERLWPAQWAIGLTGKSFQNVLRSKSVAFGSYTSEFDKAINESSDKAKRDFGDLKIKAKRNKIGSDVTEEVEFDWEAMLRLTTAIGSQTLAIRGSDKSLYGKLFEKLILGSALTILGFTKANKKDSKGKSKVFWLSDGSAEREADATAIIDLGRIARFDIGFIGSGNSEISKDKLSRFQREIETSEGVAASTTFVIVDRLPATSKTIKAATSANAIIVQMSMSYWLKELAQKMKEVYEVESEILTISESELEEYIDNKLQEIDVSQFAVDIDIDEDTDIADSALIEPEL